MKFTTLSLAAAAIGLCFAACSNDNTDGDGTAIPVDTGDPAIFTLSISEPAATRAADNDNATADETKFTTADIFIYSDNVLATHVRLDKDDFTLTGAHIWTTTSPVETTSGEKEFYVGLNMPAALGQAMAATKNKTALSLLSRTDVYPLIDTNSGFVMFSTEPEVVTLQAKPATNSVTVKVGRLVAKVTVQEGENLKLPVVIENEGSVDNLEFAIRNSNKLYWPYQKKVGDIVYDPNWTESEWKENDFEQGSDYVGVDAYATEVKDRKVKYTPENTSEKTQRRETTYASVKAQYIPAAFSDVNGNLTPNTALKSFWVVSLNDTGEAYYFDDFDVAKTFAENKGTVSDKYEDGYCYYNLFLNPSNDFQTYRNTFYQLRITSITGLGNPNPSDEGNTTEPVTKPANISIVVDIQPWNVELDNYELY